MQKLNFFFFSLLILLASCNSNGFEEQELGGNLIDNSTDVRLIDTFTINTSTVIVDSMATSGANSLTVGRYVDPLLGKVRSTGYSKIGLGTGGFKLEKNDQPVYDSIVFITYYANAFYGDTTKTQNLSMHRVVEEIEVEDDGKLYNVKKFDFEEESLGQKSFKARPKRVRKNDKNQDVKYNFRMHLNDSFGEELIQMAIRKSDTLTDVNIWENYMQGVALRSDDDDDAAMLNFLVGDTLMKIRLYYREKSGENTDKVLHHDFPIGQSAGFRFSNYESDRTGTLIEDLKEQEKEISADLTEDMTFIQGGVGLLTKVDIPHLKELAKIGLSGSLLDAKLIFYAKPGTHDKDIYRLPDLFNIYLTDDQNRILPGLINPTNGQLLNSIFAEDKEYEENSFYAFDLTSYVNNVLVNGEEEDQALLISLPFATLSSQMDRMVITNDKSSDFEIKLKATYVVQKQ